MDPAKPLTPKIYSEIMEGIRATQMRVNLDSANIDNNDGTTIVHNTKIPVIQVSFQSARQLKSLMNVYADSHDRPLITIANELPNKIPLKIRAKHTAV